MKRAKGIATISGLLLIWLGSGCSENPALKARYRAEKMFFRAEKAARQARIRPDLNAPEVPTQLHQLYSATLEFCYRALDSLPISRYPTEHAELAELAFRSATRLSQFYFAEERFDSCVSILGRVLKSANLSDMTSLTTHLNLGRALQSAGQWDSALAIYNYSLENFYPPANDRGEIVLNLFNLPNHIYDIYIRVGDSAAAQAQVDKAENYYRRLITDYSGSNLAGAGHLSLASLYEHLGLWEEAVDELVSLTDTVGSLATSAGLRVASLHASQLNRPELAIEQYDQILERLTGRDTLRRPMILFNKALVHLYQHEYSDARQTLVDVKRRYREFFNRTPTVQFAIARSFELQDNWGRAETEYKYLINNFPASEESLSTYLYLIDQYSRRGRQVEAKRMEQRAETEYERLATTRPGTLAEAIALTYQAELHRRRADRSAAINLLVEVFHRFPTSEIGFRNMVAAALIYRDELGNQAAADSLIQELKRRLTTVDETPDF